MTKINKILITILLFALSLITVNAQTTYVFDDANTLTNSEITELDTKLAKNTDIITSIYFSNPSGNTINDPETTCQSLISDNSEGVCFIVDFDSNSYYLQLVNGAQDKYQDDDINPLYDLLESDISSQDLYQAVVDFADYFNSLEKYTGDYNKDAEVENLDQVAIMDLANLLSENETAKLENQIASFKENTNYDFAFLSVDDNSSGKDIEDYAYDYYFYNDFGSDSMDSGIAIVIDMDNRKYAFKTFGRVIDKINDSEVSTIDSSLQNYLSNGQYYQAISYVLNQVENVANSQTVTSDNTGISIQQILIGLFGGLITAGLFVFALIRQLNNVSAKKDANDFIENNSLRINRSLDLYLYTSVTKTAKPKKSSGGSSSGFGSGGTRSGGSSGSF